MIALKVLCLIITKGKVEDDMKIDIIKNSLLPGLLINLLKTILKLDNNKQLLDVISELIKTTCLLAKATFDKNVGIEITYISMLLPLIPPLIKIGAAANDVLHQALLINIVKRRIKIRFYDQRMNLIILLTGEDYWNIWESS